MNGNGERPQVTQNNMDEFLGIRHNEEYRPRKRSVKNLILLIISFLMTLPVGITIIVNLAINGELTWAYFPMAAIGFAWGILILPMMLGKIRVWKHLLALSLLITPFLFIIDNLVNNWISTAGFFYDIALPIINFSLIFLWLIYIVERFLPVNGWYKAAVTVVLLGCSSVAVNIILINYFGIITNWNYLEIAANIFGTVILAFTFSILGHNRSRKLRSKEEMPANHQEVRYEQ